MTKHTRAPITVCILTKNEEIDLPLCLETIPHFIPVTLIDSGSTDETLKIGEKRNVSIYRHEWAGFVNQRNFAVQCLSSHFEWVLFIDADERLNVPLLNQILSEIKKTDACDVYWIPSRLYFENQLLRFAPGYPIMHPRLVRTVEAPFVSNHQGHGEDIRADLRSGVVNIPYDHYFYAGNIVEWMHKHIDLARTDVFSHSKILQMSTNRARLAAAVPPGYTRALVRFIYHYLFCLGILDGVVGFRYCSMYLWYEITKSVIKSTS